MGDLEIFFNIYLFEYEISSVYFVNFVKFEVVICVFEEGNFLLLKGVFLFLFREL